MIHSTSTEIEIYKEVLNDTRKRFPSNFWQTDNIPNYTSAQIVTIYLIEEILHWSTEDIKENLSLKTFQTYKLSGMISILFSNSPFKALDNAFPGKFKEWELSKSPHKFWNLKKAKEATIWLIEEKLNWSDEQIKRNLSAKIFKEHGLYGMLFMLFNSSPFKALDNAYPGKFKEWELAQVPINFWNLKTAKRATIWLLKEKLNWSNEQIKQNLSAKTFLDNGFSSILSLFNSSPFKALDNAYPGQFKEWELAQVPINFWTLKTAKRATIWLFEEKLQWDEEKIKQNLSAKVFYDNGLKGMLLTFQNSPFKALDNAYPGKFKPNDLVNSPKKRPK